MKTEGKMKQITLRTDDEQTVAALLDYVQELEHISDVDVVEVNGRNGSHSNSAGRHDTLLYQDPRQLQMDREVAAFEQQHPQLVASYLGQYVAIHGGEIVDHDADELALAKRIRRNYEDEVVLVREVQATLPGPLYFRSHRIVD